MLALIVVGGVGAALGWLSALQTIGGALAYLIFAIAYRLVRRRRLRSFVDEALNELERMRVVRPLRRVDSGR